eukprot:2223361-Pyramimonas_sp.AAC.1
MSTLPRREASPRPLNGTALVAQCRGIWQLGQDMGGAAFGIPRSSGVARACAALAPMRTAHLEDQVPDALELGAEDVRSSVEDLVIDRVDGVDGLAVDRHVLCLGGRARGRRTVDMVTRPISLPMVPSRCRGGPGQGS